MDEQTQTNRTRSPELDRFLDDLKAVVRDGQELLQASVTGVKSKAMDSARTAETSVREHPLKSVAIAFGVGIVLGAVLVGLTKD